MKYYLLNVLQDGNKKVNHYTISSGTSIKREVLQVVGLILDGGTPFMDTPDTPIELAKMYVEVRELNE